MDMSGAESLERGLSYAEQYSPRIRGEIKNITRTVCGHYNLGAYTGIMGV